MPPVNDEMIFALLSTIMPEYISKQWAPVDQGTIGNHINQVQDHLYTAANPLWAVLSGTLDPSTLQPTVTETPVEDPNKPVAPTTPLLAMYEGRDDFITQAWLDFLQRGYNPSAAVEDAYKAYNRAVETGEMEGEKVELRDPEGSYKPEVQAVLDDAVKVRDEIAAKRLYDQQLESYQPPAPQVEVEESDLAQELRAMGIDPTKTAYTPEMFRPPEYDAVGQLVKETAKKSKKQTAQHEGAAADYRNARKAKEGGQAEKNAYADSIGQYQDYFDAAAQLGPNGKGDTGLGLKALFGAAEAFRNNPGPQLQDDWYRDARDRYSSTRRDMVSTNRQNANLRSQRRIMEGIAQGQAQQLQAQGRNPIYDAVMERLGLSLQGQAR